MDRKRELEIDIKNLKEDLADWEQELKEAEKEQNRVQINIARGNGVIYANYSIGGMSIERIKRKIEKIKTKIAEKEAELTRL